MIAYHFVGPTLRDGSPIPADGEWLEVAPPIKMCSRGLHASVHPFDALGYAPGNTLCLVELAGQIKTETDKCVASRRRIIARFDAEPLLREFVLHCALSVIHLWKAPDVVRQYLESGDESLRSAARDAARDAARSAARGAAPWDAARGAAWAAARSAAPWDAACEAAWEAAWEAVWAAAQRGAA